jgi:HlyD family secretion protein
VTAQQRRFALWGVLALLLAVGLVFAFWPRAVPVDLATVERGPLLVTVDEEGETRVRDVHVLSAPVSGRLRRIEAEAGDEVVAGETIVAQIEPIDPTLLDVRSESEAKATVRAASAARDTAAAEVQRAEANLAYAQTELARQQNLMDRGAVSQRDLDAARREFRTTRAALETARAAFQERIFDLDRAQARLVSPIDTHKRGADCECIPLRAPVSGRVLRVMRESEGPVQAGDPLLEIGDPSDLEVVVELLSADAVKVQPGARAILEEWGGGEPLEARVRRVEPYGFTKVSALGIEEQRVKVILDFVEPREKWQALGHGYRVEARIVLWEGDDVLKIPLSALFRDGDHWAVFEADDGTAHLREVQRGRHTGLEAEVVSGLEAGERVVLYPSDRVSDGVSVVPRRSLSSEDGSR